MCFIQFLGIKLQNIRQNTTVTNYLIGILLLDNLNLISKENYMLKIIFDDYVNILLLDFIKSIKTKQNM